MWLHFYAVSTTPPCLLGLKNLAFLSLVCRQVSSWVGCCKIQSDLLWSLRNLWNGTSIWNQVNIQSSIKVHSCFVKGWDQLMGVGSIMNDFFDTWSRHIDITIHSYSWKHHLSNFYTCLFSSTRQNRTKFFKL